MQTLLLIVNILSALGMIGLILLQQGKGAEAGASFGGASGTVFGAAGTANFMTRTTAILTAIFFASTLGLAIIAKRQSSQLLGPADTLGHPSAPLTSTPPATPPLTTPKPTLPVTP